MDNDMSSDEAKRFAGLIGKRYRLPHYRIHELADKYPMMSEEEKTELGHSLRTVGQQAPIWLLDGEIIDGRNRYLIYAKWSEEGTLNVEPKFQEYKGDKTKLEDVIEALNVHRRHLTPSQKAAIGVKNHLRIQRDFANERQQSGVSLKISEGGKTSEVISKIVGVSTTYVEKAMKVVTDKDLFKHLENGQLNINDADIIASHATPDQKAEIVTMLNNNQRLGLKSRIAAIKPRKKHKKIDEKSESPLPSMIIFQNLDLNNELVKEKIQELNNILAASAAPQDSIEIWYKPDTDATSEFKNEINRWHKKWNPIRFHNGKQIEP
jgi:hypothetical protein